MGAGRIWVDVTGISPGSDAAVFAEGLCGGFGRVGADFTLCRRDPGLRVFNWPEVEWCRNWPASAGPSPSFSRRQRLADIVPTPTRRAIMRFFRLQRAVVMSWRGGTVSSSTAPPTVAEWSDAVSPGADDVLLMLGVSGDASRFAKAGARLAVLLVDAMPVLRPDWVGREARREFEVWRSVTAPLLGAAMAVSAAGVAALERLEVGAEIRAVRPAAVPHDAPAPLAPRRFVLAAGPIGVAGATGQLLLAWRRLMETMAEDDVPELVLAGPVGTLADDALAQVRNSAGLGGKVVVVPFPSAELLAGLVRDCLFCIAPDATGWGRATWEAMGIGRPCLSASGLEGAVEFDPQNAAALAELVRAWLVELPLGATAAPRGWDELARDVAGAVLP